jgi:NADH-quinone oxidoreductase E subunit
MAVQFSPASRQQIDELLPRYPTRMAACLPVLWIAQDQFGWISQEVMDLVAETLDLPLSHVYGVVTFYTMFNQQPRGTFHVQVCTNVACMLLDAYEVLRRFERELGVRCGETTPDKLFTLSEVECLAACGSGPCVQINDEYREPVRPEDVAELVAQLRRGAAQAAAGGLAEVAVPAKAAASDGQSTPGAGGAR